MNETKLFQGQSLFQWLFGKDNGKVSPAVEKAVLNASNQLYVKELALYTAVGLVADLLSGCEIQVFRQGQPVHDGNWFRLNIRPNENQSGAEFKAQIVQKLYYDGQALIVPVAGKLYVASSFQREEYPILGDKFLNVYLESLQLQKQFRAGDVYFLTQGDRSVRRLVDGVFMGYADLLAASSDAVKAGAGEKYALQVGRLPSGTPEEQQKYMSKLQENLQTFVKAQSAAYPLTKEQTLTRFSGGTSASANSVTDLRKDVYAIVASALHLPESLLSGNITSVEQVTNQALTFAIDPLAKRISDEITAKTWTEDEITRQGCKAVVNTTRIQHIDPVNMAGNLDKLLASGMACIDENRDLVGWPEIGTDWSRRHYITKNYDTVENTLDPLEGGENNA